MTVRHDLLAEALHLPEGTHIIGVDGSPLLRYNEADHFEICVEHDDLPAVLEGCEIPVINPIFTVETQVEYLVPYHVIFCDWNIHG
jgi:hypothetical protein